MKAILYLHFILISLTLHSQETLKAFLKKEMGLSSSNHSIRAHHSNDPAEKGRNSEIFYISIPDQEKSYVIKKLLTKDHRAGFEEKYSLETFASFGLTFVEPIQLHGYKTYSDFSLIGMSHAEGLTLSKLTEEVGSTPRYTKSHMLALNELKVAIAKTAYSFRELHKKSAATKMHSYYLRRNEKIIETFLSHSSAFSLPSSKEEYARYLQAASEKFHKRSDHLGVIHGDAHPGNILYNSKSRKISLIDFGDMYPSLQNPDEGGSYLEDYLRILFYLKLISIKNHLPWHEIQEVETLFDQIYFDDPNSFPKEDLLFLRQVLAMQGVNMLLEKDGESIHPLLNFKNKFVIESLLNQIKIDYELSK